MVADAEARERDFRSGGRFALGPGYGGSQGERRAYEAARQEQARLLGVVTGLTADLDAANAAITAGPPTIVPPAEKEKKAKKAREQRMATQAEYDEELRRLAIEELQDQLALTSDIEKRAELQEGILSLERQSRIAAVQNDAALTDERKKQLIALINLRYGLDEHGNIVTNANKAALVGKELTERENELRQDALRDEIATVEAGADLLTNRKYRLAAERRILDLIEQEERMALEKAIADGQVLDAARARANLATRQDARREGTERQFESPLQRYRRETAELGNNIDDAMERVAVDGLDALNDGIVDAITGAKSLGEAFGNVADQIIKDLLRIGIQRAIIGPLADSLFGAEGGGGGLLRTLFGRASGGYVGPGQMVRVNEGASAGRVEGFMPSGGGQIIPLGRMNAVPSGGTTVVQQTFVLDARGGVTTTDLINQMNNLARQAAVEGAQGGRALAARDMGAMQRPRI